MKFLYIRLVNYIGIFNGLGIKEINIDLVKCKNRIVIIKGKNGSGKSTLFNAMSPLPDSNDQFIPQLKAIKEIGILFDGIVYDIKFIHDVNNKHPENRETTKGYIKKNGVELNPNGNVTSYKDILFVEFNLDSSFVELSKLSSGNRGLADKKPAERKKFMSSIISKVEVYNNMLKTISKRSSVFKSMVNNITVKIDQLGDKAKIEATLVSIEDRINKLLDEKDLLFEEMSMHKSSIKIKDPDGSIQILYNKIYDDINKINPQLNELELKIKKMYHDLDINIDTNISELYSNLNTNLTKYEISLQNKESQINSLMSNRDDSMQQLQQRTAKLYSLTLDKNYNDLENSIIENRTKVNEYEDIINMIGLDKNNLLTKDEYILGLNTLLEIKEIINIFKSGLNMNILRLSVDKILSNEKVDLESIQNSIIQYTELINSNNLKMQEYEVIKTTLEILDLRPKNCNINDCSFINNALNLNSKYPDIDKSIDDLSMENECYSELINKLNFDLKLNKDIFDCMNYLSRIIRTIGSHRSILSKLPHANIFTDINVVLNKILNHDTFSEIDSLYQYIDYCNVLDEYIETKNILYTLETDYRIYQSRNELIQEITSDIEEMNIKLNKLLKLIEDENNNILELKKNISNLKSKLLDIEILLGILRTKGELDNQKNGLLSSFMNIKGTIQELKIHSDAIYNLDGRLQSISKSLRPLMDDRDTLKHNIKLVDEYRIELNEYSQKYEKINTIKTYLSPSEKGIQLIFIEMYMNNTIHLTNELLSRMFDGEYLLEPFRVDEDGFKIPCTNYGFRNDDISSMSTSQICMISMILSFVLLKQSSTKYNIIRLDEVDSGLDGNNRKNFIVVLEDIVRLLECEQVILITHNQEMDLSNCDIIQLKKVNIDESNVGNVIYEY